MVLAKEDREYLNTWASLTKHEDDQYKDYAWRMGYKAAVGDIIDYFENKGKNQ